MDRRITLAPGTEQHFNRAVSAASVRSSLGFGAAYSDTEIDTLLAQAIEFVEGLAGIILRKASYEVAWQGFPMHGGPLVIPGFVRALSTIRYVDLDGELETLLPAHYSTRLVEPRNDMWVFPDGGESLPEVWPEESIAYAKRDGVIATITAGVDYSNDGDLPADLQAAIMHSIRWIHDESAASKSIAMCLARKFYEHG